MKIVSIFISVITYAYYLSFWTKCRDLLSQFHFSSFDLRLRLMESIHSESGQNLLLTRAFNNKVTGTALDVFRIYTNFFNTQFLLTTLSPIALFGIGYFSYLVIIKRKGIKYYVLLFLLIAAPLIEIFNLFGTDKTKIILLAPYLLTSLLGIWWFLGAKEHKIFRIIFFMILFIISLWWISVFGDDISKYCAMQ